MVNFNFDKSDHYYYLCKVSEYLANIIKANHYDPIEMTKDGNFLYKLISKPYVHNKYGDNRRLLLVISSKNVIACSNTYDIQSFYLFDKHKLLSIDGTEKDVSDLHVYFFKDKKDSNERRGFIENGIDDLHFQLLLRYIKDQYNKHSDQLSNNISLPLSDSINKFTIDKEYLNFSPLNY